MYGKLGSTSIVAMPAGTLVVGGIETLWYVVAACTLLAAVLALLRMLPRRER